MRVIFFHILSLWVATYVHAATPQLVNCQLTRKIDASNWNGQCGTSTFDGVTAKSVATGIWREDARPILVVSGTIGAGPGSDVELEIYEKGTAILRTQGGWFWLKEVARSSTTLTFHIDRAALVGPSDLDRTIVQHAATLLATESSWNRADDRQCPSGQQTLSIYCALERATKEVTGGFHHRRPALEIVREIVDERSVNRNYAHRLMDYNNDRSTRLSDVQSLFTEALGRMKP